MHYNQILKNSKFSPHIAIAQPTNSIELAAIYIESFPELFRSRLGLNVCKRYFESIIDHDGFNVLVARKGLEVLGYIVLHSDVRIKASKRWMWQCWPELLTILYKEPLVLLRWGVKKVFRPFELLRNRIKIKKMISDTSFSITEKRSYIDSVGVKKSFRGMGVGTQLVDESVKKALEKGAKRVGLTVDVQNLAARHLYEAAGFSVTSEDQFSNTICYHKIFRKD